MLAALLGVPRESQPVLCACSVLCTGQVGVRTLTGWEFPMWFLTQTCADPQTPRLRPMLPKVRALLGQVHKQLFLFVKLLQREGRKPRHPGTESELYCCISQGSLEYLNL